MNGLDPIQEEEVYLRQPGPKRQLLKQKSDQDNQSPVVPKLDFTKLSNDSPSAFEIPTQSEISDCSVVVIETSRTDLGKSGRTVKSVDLQSVSSDDTAFMVGPRHKNRQRGDD